MRKEFFGATALAIALTLVGCQQAPPPAPKPDLEAEKAKIKEIDAAWLKDWQARDAAKHAAYFAEDGSWSLTGLPKATGREAIQKLAKVAMEAEVSGSWTASKIVVSESADLAYQEGSWESIDKDPKGKQSKSVGKFLTVWKKQPDGTWKVQADCSNADGPPVPVR